MKRKLLSFAILMLGAALLAGCGNKTSKAPVNTTKAPSTTTQGGGNVTTKGDEKPVVKVGDFTYKTYATSLGNNWNPHTWETNADDSILSYLSVGFVDMSIKDSEEGVYQWVFEMATEVNDVTASHKNDLTKYKSTLPKGKTLDDVDSQYVYEIKLNPNAKWQNGEAINADTYVESMKLLLDPEMMNYRANLTIAGESALAGAYEYYYSKTEGIYVGIGTKYANNAAAVAANETIYIDAFEFYGASGYTTADGTEKCPKWVAFNDTTVYGNYEEAFDKTNPEHCDPFDPVANADYWMDEKYLDPESEDYLDPESEGYAAAVESMWNALDDNDKTAAEDAYYADAASVFYDEFSGADLWAYYLNPTSGAYKGYVEVGGDYASWLSIYQLNDEYDPEMTFDGVVGLYKVDDYTINYVLKTQQSYNYFMTSLTTTWLVYKPYYEASYDTTGELKTTKYGTTVENTMSYGPYKLESLQDDKQIVFTRNENWYGYQKDENGNIYSVTQFEVDGKHVQQYQTSKIVIDVMTDEAAKLEFLKGDLDDWAPSSSELSEYTLSPQLYKVDETYTMSFFFNTNVDALKKMDESKGNTNSVVLSNINFRKAFSLAINRAEWVTSTAGYKPNYALMNDLYFYNIYEDPNSKYRASDQAMQAVCNLYGIEYGEGKIYATLKEAYESVTGYNLTEAKALMKTACDELVAAGLYTAGQPIVINVGYKKGALDSDDNKQVLLMQNYLNAAVEGSGFGAVTLTPVGNINDRYKAVPQGEYAIGYGAWGGAAFYPFRNLQVYMDPSQYDVNEIADWDPATETFTINVNGEDVEMTYQEWSNALIGTGEFAGEDFDVKLDVTAKLEEKFLGFYYRIPLATSTSCSMLSYKASYYTEDYNIMYGFGGLRLMTYNYNDAEWADYVAKNAVDGVLNYK